MSRFSRERLLREKDNGEVYVFFFQNTPEERAEILRTFGRYASDPMRSFNWYDASILSQQVRSETK